MALNLSELKFGEELLKSGFAKMTKGGVIMDVTNAQLPPLSHESEDY